MRKIYILFIINLFAVMLSAQSATIVANFKMDEGSGTTITDDVNGITGTLLNDVAWATGQSGTALDFGSGADSAIVIVEETDKTKGLNFTTESFSLVCWANYVNDVAAVDQYFFLKGDNGVDGPNGNGNRYGLYSKQGELRFVVDDDATKTESKLAIAGLWLDNEWNHIVCVRDVDAKKMNLYLNGALIQSADDATGPINVENQRMLIGNYHNKSSKMTGKIDDIRIYNGVLTADDVTALFTGSESSASKLNMNDISCYPNPATDLLHINIDAQNFNTEIYDMSGKTILHSSNSKEINVSSLKPGLYFLKTIDGNTVFTSRFSVVR